MYKVASTVLMRCACIELRIFRVIRIFRHILVYLAFRKLKNFSFRITLCSVCVSLWLGVIHLTDSIDWPISDEIWYEHCAPGGRSNPVLLTLPRSVITMRRIDVLVRGDNNERAFLLDSEMTSCNTFFFLVALRPDSGSWPPLTGFPDHTHSTQRTR